VTNDEPNWLMEVVCLKIIFLCIGCVSLLYWFCISCISISYDLFDARVSMHGLPFSQKNTYSTKRIDLLHKGLLKKW